MRPRHQTEIVSGAHPEAGARIADTRAMSEHHRCFPKRDWVLIQCISGGIRVSVTQPSTPASMEYRVAIWSFGFFNTKKIPQNTKIFIWKARLNMISPVIFAGALTSFAGVLPRGPHPGGGADSMRLWNCETTHERNLLFTAQNCANNTSDCKCKKKKINNDTRLNRRLSYRGGIAQRRPTRPPTLSGTGSEYRPKCGDALRLGSKVRVAHSSCEQTCGWQIKLFDSSLRRAIPECRIDNVMSHSHKALQKRYVDFTLLWSASLKNKQIFFIILGNVYGIMGTVCGIVVLA